MSKAQQQPAPPPQYWVVGAMFNNGREDHSPGFLRRGYWELGWSDADAPDQASRRDQVRSGDRIAIKKMMGRGSRKIRITTLGIVLGMGPRKRVRVKWIVRNLDRQVSGNGCFKSIHGPFSGTDSWVQEAFVL
jgi:hypothetical protein